MKTFVRSFQIIIVLGALLVFNLRAQTVTVLDGFQETALGMPPGTTTNGYTAAYCNFVGSRGFCDTNIALFIGYGGRSAQGQVSIAQYTATNANDPNVTEGTNSMAITFSAQGFGNDFQIVLSDTNSLLVEQAAVAGQAGRYILRYDVIFCEPVAIHAFQPARLYRKRPGLPSNLRRAHQRIRDLFVRVGISRAGSPGAGCWNQRSDDHRRRFRHNTESVHELHHLY